MNGKLVLASGLILLLIGIGFTITVRTVKASKTIYIRANGLIEGTDKITSADNTTYTITANINDSIVVERSNIIINGNGYTIEGETSSPGFTFMDLHNIEIYNTNVRGFGHGIYAYNTSKLIVHNNNITSNEYNGIRLHRCLESNITQNQVMLNIGYGLHLLNSSLCTASDNIIILNRIGVWLETGALNHVFMNTITTNYYSGIEIHSSSKNIVEANNVTANKLWGLALSASTNNTILENNFEGHTNNTYGFGVCLATYAGNNTFYHNTFQNNTIHVYIYPSANYSNVWDNDYPSGGNFWGDYVGVDQYSGPDQNETGSDGIWDHPYIIDENNQDNYPIVPEFPSFLVLPLFMTMSLLYVITRKRFTVQDQ